MLKTKLWKHQVEMKDYALERFGECGYVLWIAGMAVGKTLTTLAVREETGAKLTLILTTKAALESTWPSEVEKHTTGVEVLALTEYMTVKNKRRKVTVKDKGRLMLEACRNALKPLVVVINYDSARDLGSEIAACGFNLVVADECHKLKNPTSKTLKVLAKACINVPAKIGMTGTAFNDKPIDVFGQVAFLSPDFYRGNVMSTVLGRYGDFFDAYVNYYVKNNIKIPVKQPNRLPTYKNIENLQNILNAFTYYVDTEKVLDLPPTMYLRRTVQPSKKFLEAYRSMRDDMVVQLGDKIASADNILTLSLRLAQMTGGYATPYHVDSEGNLVSTGTLIEMPDGEAKVNALLDIMDECGSEPVVIFTRFTSDLNRIKTTLQGLEYEVLELSGKMHQHIEFQAGKGQVLVANLSAGSAGITLTRSRIVIDYSLGYSRSDYDQSRYRVRRPDSNKLLPVVYYQLAVAGTIDELILDALQTKGDMSDLLKLGLQGYADKIA